MTATAVLARPETAESAERTPTVAVLGEAGVNIEMISTSEIRITCLIDRRHLETAARALHKAFELEEAS
jgi:aspartokinase